MGGSKKQTVGYKYLIGMHQVLCQGPIDSITRITADDREAWTGNNTGGQITIDKPNLFGGDEREGGIGGVIDIDMGYPDQQKNSYLRSILGDLIPAYRGVVSAVFRRFWMGNNPYLKPFRFRGSRIYVRQDGIEQWYPAKAGIPDVGNEVPGPIVALNLPATGMFGPWDDPGHVRVIEGSSLTIHERPAAADSNGELLYDSFSPWAHDGQFGVVDTWRNDFVVYGGGADANSSNGVGFVLLTDPISNDTTGPNSPYSNTPAQSLAKLQATLPRTFTGYQKYAIMTISDSAWFDNRGGLSLYYQSTISAPFDMNPIHMIRECLTDPDWGLGYTDGDIDNDNFVDAADTIYSEGLGMSLIWDKQIELEKFIDEIKKHIDAAVFVSRKTGKYKVKLIRQDYNADDLITLDETNISRIENPKRASYGELTNSVTVNYWDRYTGKDASLTVTDTALVQQQNGVINVPVQYPGFTNFRNASVAGARDLKTLSSPGLSCTVYADSTAKDLELGDVFKLNWAQWGVYQLPMRITNIAYGTGRNNQVRITCTEDNFETVQSVVIEETPSAWENPNVPPAPTPETLQLAFEAPYYEIVQANGQLSTDTLMAANPDLGYVMATLGRSSGGIKASMWTDSGAGYEDVGPVDYAPTATLAEAIGPKQQVIKLANMQDVTEVTLGTHVQVGDELMRIDFIDHSTGDATVGRGVLDTVPAAHNSGARLFFWDVYAGNDATEYLYGEEIDVKLTSLNGSGVVALEDAIEMTVAMDRRALRPYPPGNLLVEGLSYDDTAIYKEELSVAWAHRNRLYGTGPLIDHSAGDIGPEPGTTYRVQGYLDGELIHTEDDIAGTSTVWTPPSEGIVKVEVHSKRDGLYSWQGPSHTFFYTGGSVRIDMDNNTRYTEEGDLRVTED